VVKAPTVLDLVWSSGLIFSGRSGQASLTLDSAGIAGPSPVQALAFALAGCMLMDVADILTKGRHTFRALRSHLVADRADTEPHQIVRVTMNVTVGGNVPAAAVERAIALSREKYCSVWHSLRQDIEFTTAFQIEAGERAS
jgi:putative redox protein